jgi:hypothetical protein
MKIINVLATGQRLRFFLNSAVDGSPVENADIAIDSIQIFYHICGNNPIPIQIHPGGGLDRPHAAGAWNEIGAGWYQLDLPDQLFQTTSDLLIFGKGEGINVKPESFSFGSTLSSDSLEEIAQAIAGPESEYKEVTISVKDNQNRPVSEVFVWLTTDSSGFKSVGKIKLSDATGSVKFRTLPGSYFVWRQKPGLSFSNPTSLTVQG